MNKIHISLDTLRERERERERESRLLKTERKTTKEGNSKTDKAYKKSGIKVNNLNEGCKSATLINSMQELSFLSGIAI